MLCVVKKPGEDPEMKEIENTLEALQHEVGGYIECVMLCRGIICVINEESRLRGMEPNTLGLVGPVVFVGDAGDEFRALTEDEAEFLMHRV